MKAYSPSWVPRPHPLSRLRRYSYWRADGGRLEHQGLTPASLSRRAPCLTGSPSEVPGRGIEPQSQRRRVYSPPGFPEPYPARTKKLSSLARQARRWYTPPNGNQPSASESRNDMHNESVIYQQELERRRLALSCRDEIEDDEFDLIEEDLDKSRAVLEVAWLRGVA